MSYFYFKGVIYPLGGGPPGCRVHGWNPKRLRLPDEKDMETAKFCWDICQMPSGACNQLRLLNPLSWQLDAFVLPEVAAVEITSDSMPIEMDYLLGMELLIDNRIFPPQDKLPNKCPLYPDGFPKGCDLIVVIRREGLRLCREVALARGKDCGSCRGL